MKIMLAAGFIALSGFLIGIAGYVVKHPSKTAEFPTDQKMSSYNARLIDTPPGENFAATVTISPAAKKNLNSANQVFRIFWDVVEHADGRSYLTAEITPQSILVLAVETGLKTDLATYTGNTSTHPGRLPTQVILKRRGSQITIVSDGRRLLETSYPTFRGGRIGVGSLKNEKNLRLALPQVQPLGSIIYTDDFMRSGDDKGDWLDSPGANWEVRSLDNPAKSSNAFIYQGWGKKGGVSLIGHEYWDNYQLEVSAQGQAAGEIGLVVSALGQKKNRTSPTTYTFIRWSANPAATKTVTKKSAAKKSSPGKLEMVQVIAGKEKILASQVGGYTPGQWYRLAASLNEGTVRFFIDGHQMLQAKSPYHSGGKAGLYVKGNLPAEFDDLQLMSYDRLQDSSPATQPKQSGIENYPDDTLGSLSIMDEDNLTNVRIAAEVRISPLSGSVSLIADYRGPGEYYAYQIDARAGKERLLAVTGGRPQTLAEGAWDKRTSGTRVFSVDHGHLAAGNLEAFIETLPAGRVGYGADKRNQPPEASPSQWTNFTATSIKNARPVTSLNEVFNEENLMAVWNGAAGDWQIPKYKGGGGYQQVLWHRGFFFGDTEIEATLPKTGRGNWELALSLAKPVHLYKPSEPKTKTASQKREVAKTSTKKEAKKTPPAPRKLTGYVMRLIVNQKRVAQLHLVREGKEVTSVTLPPRTPLTRLRFRRAGAYLLGYIDDHLRLTWRDPAPLNGPKLAIASKGIQIHPEQVRIFNRQLMDYAFNDAPADWRTAGGIWQVTNRWECDPRWSFMAGMPPPLAKERASNLKKRLTAAAEWKIGSLQSQLALVPDPDDKLAALWHKAELKGDLLFECFVGPMMEFARGGGRYNKYIKNFALTIGADGNDLNSGYSCILGYDNNKRSVILRQGKVVAEISGVRHVIPVTKNFHHKWVRLRVERIANQIVFSAFYQDRRNRPETRIMRLTFTDDKPLTGQHVAVWSYGCGMLIGRARIAAEKILGMENPLRPRPAVAACVYTQASQTEAGAKAKAK